MRVNVQYTIELKQIPKEMKKLVGHSVVEKLRQIAKSIEDSSFDENTLDDISEARASLYEVDERLSDVDAIMRGYYHAIHGTQQAEEVAPVQEKESEHNFRVDVETMAQIKQHLAEHRVETYALRRTFQGWTGDSDEQEEEK